MANLPVGYRYAVQQADATAPGGFRDVAGMTVLPNSNTVSLPGANGCYRLFREDVCRQNPAFSAATICTLSLRTTSSQNRNQLLLTDAGTGSSYTVTRNGTAIMTLVPIAGGLEDTDPALLCGTSYTYRVTARQANGGESVSNESAITTVSNLPPPTPRLVATFDAQNRVTLLPRLAAGPLPAGGTLRYQRTAGGSGPVGFGQTLTTVLRRDSTAVADLLAAPPCYTVRLVDICGNVSAASAATCPALLTAIALDADGNQIQLRWNDFTGPETTAPAYTLQVLNADGTVRRSVPGVSSPYTDFSPADDPQILRYRLQISGAGVPADTVAYSNRASLARRVRVAVPTAFTPNGDGLNDVLEIKGRFLTSFTFIVVDRNGQQVFRATQRADTWDGRINGRDPVNGAYVWRYQQTDETGQPVQLTGTVTILK